MPGEMISGVAIFTITILVLLFGWLSSEYAKRHDKPQERIKVVGDRSIPKPKENVSDELPEPPAMRQGNGERVPLQKRVQPIKTKDTSTAGRSDTAYASPVVDTFD